MVRYLTLLLFIGLVWGQEYDPETGEVVKKQYDPETGEVVKKQYDPETGELIKDQNYPDSLLSPSHPKVNSDLKNISIKHLTKEQKKKYNQNRIRIRKKALTRRYWESVGGTLIEEFPAVGKSPTNSRRLMDGVIILNEEHRIAKATDVDIEGKDIIVIQSKANRLGMYLMGQAFFSKELMKKFNPKSIRTVAICGKDDSVMRSLSEEFGIEVVVYND